MVSLPSPSTVIVPVHEFFTSYLLPAILAAVGSVTVKVFAVQSTILCVAPNVVFAVMAVYFVPNEPCTSRLEFGDDVPTPR